MTLPDRYASPVAGAASYDDLPDAAVRVVLAVPLQAPTVVLPAATSTPSLPGAPVSHRRRVSEPARPRVRRRHAGQRSRRTFPAAVEASVVGLTAAAIVFVTVAVVLILIDLRLA